MAKDYALITGGSHGIGKAMAEEFALRGINLLLIALLDKDLENTHQEINSRYDVDIKVLGIDLREENAPQRIYQYCLEKLLNIKYLINNAGLGDGGLFQNISLEKYHTILELNNRALVELTYLLLNNIKDCAPSFILNTSSIEATLPLPYKAVYTATKSFIYAFSLALNEELRSEKVKVSVLCPSSVITNEEGMLRYKSHGARAKLVVKMPEEVARYAIRKMLKGRTVIIPGVINQLIVIIARFLPESMKMRILERLFRVYRGHHVKD